MKHKILLTGLCLVLGCISISALTSQNRLNHNDNVLASAIKAANKYGVAICLLYDIGSMEDDNGFLRLERNSNLI